MQKDTAARILELFDMVESANPALVSIIRTSSPQPHNELTLLTYGKHRYMILGDSKAADSKEQVQQIFEDTVLIPSTGHVVSNPTQQPEEMSFGVQYTGNTYYLWSYDKDE